MSFEIKGFSSIDCLNFFSNELAEAFEEFYQLMPITIAHAPIETCQFRNDANLIGAAKHYNTVNKIGGCIWSTWSHKYRRDILDEKRELRIFKKITSLSSETVPLK